MTVRNHIREIAERAKKAGPGLRRASYEQKNAALAAIKTELLKHSSEIYAANQKDLELNSELSAPLRKRLTFQSEKLTEVITGIDSLIALGNPVGDVLEARELAPGLNLYKLRCPVGLIAMIFESRPDAAVQIASLALKSANSILLKGGRESRETVKVLTAIIHDAACAEGLPPGWLGYLESREDVAELLDMDDLVDLIIPRGSKDFVRHIMDNSRIPVLGHADGICHFFVDEYADMTMAVQLVIDSKTQYAAVCNALETLLVHAHCAEQFLPTLAAELRKRAVEMRACPLARKIVPDSTPASPEDWSTEYLDNILAIKVVGSLQEATAHINCYGSGHSDGIVTGDAGRAEQFMDEVDTANALWNCSTRFSDGYRYGLGAEVGISTGKIHARGPMGMEGLTTYQWRLMGGGDCVSSFPGGRGFTHQDIALESYPFKSKNKNSKASTSATLMSTPTQKKNNARH